jgi:hypothetical protein
MKMNPPMKGKCHYLESKLKISNALSIKEIKVYNLSNELIYTFKNSILLANWLNIHKSTVHRYIKSS